MVAGAFHMDPADVWGKGSDFDIAMRIAAERRLSTHLREQQAGG